MSEDLKKEVKKEKTEEKAETKTEAKSEGKATKKPAAKAKKKAKKRTVLEGKAYIQATFNNTIVTITEPNGQVIAWSSAGSSGFKGAKKATPYAAQVSAENAATKAKVFGIEKAHVYVKGVGSGREQAIRGLQSSGINIESITDLTPTPHNGCRPRKSRRV